MWDEVLGTEEPMRLDSQKAASTILRAEMAQHCPDKARQRSVLLSQTEHTVAFHILFTFSVISVFSFGFLSFRACLHHYFQASSWSMKSPKVLPAQRKAARQGITNAGEQGSRHHKAGGN